MFYFNFSVYYHYYCLFALEKDQWPWAKRKIDSVFFLSFNCSRSIEIDFFFILSFVLLLSKLGSGFNERQKDIYFVFFFPLSPCSPPLLRIQNDFSCSAHHRLACNPLPRRKPNSDHVHRCTVPTYGRCRLCRTARFGETQSWFKFARKTKINAIMNEWMNA